MTDVFGVDIETSSRAPLKTVGASKYLHHQSTVCLMVSWWPIGDRHAPRLWCHGDPVPDEIVWHTQRGGSWSGWNVLNFDRHGWRLLLERLGFPPIPDDLWIDSIHLAAAANLPRSLDGCAKALQLPFVADLKDNKRIGRITDQTKTPLTWDTTGHIHFGDRIYGNLKPAQLAALDDDMTWLKWRCVQDVALESAVVTMLPAWPKVQPWLHMPAIDRRINDRGVLIDVPLVLGMAKAAADETTRLDREMFRFTNGQVEKCTSVPKLKQWLVAAGVDLVKSTTKAPDDEILEGITDQDDAPVTDEEKETGYRLRKNDMANLLAGWLPGDDTPEQRVRTVLFMRMEAAKASVRKLRAMLNAADDDGRLRGMLTLMGAQATGRFSSGRAQLHNLVRDAFGKDWENIAKQNGLDPRKDKALAKQLATQALAMAIEVGRRGDAEEIRMLYTTRRKDLQGREREEGVLPWVSRMMRRTIAAPFGKVLLNGDYSNIQARLPVWLAGQQETVDAFARGEDLYRIQAAPIYNKLPADLTGEERQIGKVMRLFLGFGAGVNAFIPAAMIYGIVVPKEQGKGFVDVFRGTNAPLVKYWHANLACARAALLNPGREFSVPPTNYVSWKMDGDSLCLRLPSGRYLRYWEPRLERAFWEDGRPKDYPDLTVLVVKGPFRFRRTLWHGLAMQNLVCAIEADLLAGGLVNMYEAGLEIDLHVHDSIAGEIAEDQAEAALPVFKQCMLAHPNYYAGLPIAADCDISARFA